MPLEDILERILKDTEKEELAVIGKREEEARKIIEDAKTKASLVRASYEERAREDAETAKRQRTSSATLEGRSYLEQEREKIENGYMEALRSRIIELRKTDEYLNHIQSSINRAREALGPDSIIYLDKDDAERLKGKGFTSARITNRVGPLGGVIVTSADGKMILDLTLSEIMRKKNDSIRKIVRDYING